MHHICLIEVGDWIGGKIERQKKKKHYKYCYCLYQNYQETLIRLFEQDRWTGYLSNHKGKSYSQIIWTMTGSFVSHI